MKVTRLGASEVAEATVSAMGLETGAADLSSPAALFAALRRAASFLCPTTPGALVAAVLDVIAPLGVSSLPSREDLLEMVDVLVGHGDLLELPLGRSHRTRQLFLGPPSYVERSSGQYVLIGVRPYGLPLLDDADAGTVVCDGNLRTIDLDPDTGRQYLKDAGLHRLTVEQWCKAPNPQPASAAIEPYRRKLSELGAATGQVDGLEIIDPQTSVRYYRGRRREPNPRDSGMFVARRPRSYGADLWTVVLLEDGECRALVDLPTEASDGLPQDEAWRLQAALDAHRGHPQQYRVAPDPMIDVATLVDLFAPLPSWAERRLGLVGKPAQRRPGALFTYRVLAETLGAVRTFLSGMLWMQEVDEGGAGRAE